MTKTKQSPLDFEAQLKELSQLVDDMEKGDLKLADALQKFERGVTLTKLCQQSLQQAEQIVKILTQTTDNLTDYKQENDDTLDQ